MKFSSESIKKIVYLITNVLVSIFSVKATVKNKGNDIKAPQLCTEKKDETIKEEILPLLITIPDLVSPIVKTEFLICPIQGNDKDGKALTSRTVRICSVVDHSGTAIDPSSKKHWGMHAKDQKVKAFNGEVGDGQASAGAPYGYQKQTSTPFFSSGEINYVGGVSDGSKSKYFLNYDGHAGYDFPYPKLTPVLATAGGKLCKAVVGDDPTYGASWDVDHSFFIKHENGYTSWFRHCEKLSDEVEASLATENGCDVEQGQVIAFVGNEGTKTVHLHFEVLSGGKIVDPYKDQLWEN